MKVCKWLFAALVALGLFINFLSPRVDLLAIVHQVFKFVILPHTKAPGVKGSYFNYVKVTVILMRINIPYVQLFITFWPTWSEI